MIAAVIAWLLFAPLAFVTIVFLIEMIVGLTARFPASPAGAMPRTAVLVPAHDEAAAIAGTIDMLRAVAPEARLLVVADNCTDDTAAIARAAGAEVVERHDLSARGKAHALGFARTHLALDPPDVVVIVDADCIVDAGAIQRIAAAAAAWRAPVQPRYVMLPRRDAGPLVAISGLAFLVKNVVRQSALARLGAPVELTGNGMGFPWPIFATAPLVSRDLAEDTSLGVKLARAGHFPRFLPEVTMWSTPASRASTYGQRMRWEQGLIDMARHHALPLLRSGRRGLVWLGLHLLVPPLSLLVALHLLLMLVLAAIGFAAECWSPLLVELALLALTALVIVAAWAKLGRAQMPASVLLAVPFYVLWKIPIYAATLIGRRTTWMRTNRD